MVISKEFRFEASHILPLHSGPCSRAHGHSWVLTIGINGPVNERSGFVCDFLDLKKLVNKEIIDKLDHQHLGCGKIGTVSVYGVNTFYSPYGEDFYPSSENLVHKFVEILLPLIPSLGKDIKLHHIKLNETCTSECMWISSPFEHN